MSIADTSPEEAALLQRGRLTGNLGDAPGKMLQHITGDVFSAPTIPSKNQLESLLNLHLPLVRIVV